MKRMNRTQLLAAETFSYSYANYANHLGIGNVRFEEIMPTKVRILETAELEEWPKLRLAEALEITEDQVSKFVEAFKRAKEVVDAPDPAEAFRRGVRHSIEHALEEGLTRDKGVEDLVIQICYRAADLAYLLDLKGRNISEYSDKLRREPGVEYFTSNGK